MAKKKKGYILISLFGMVITLIIHYFLLSDSNLHPTLQVLFSFLIFTIVTGLIVRIMERR
ncbi:hypothetical protein J4229_00850 [Candidatus Pacearchaeota archaeon]|nr:hypothetical protein [Candidatus Pacearchaeota archaeon]